MKALTTLKFSDLNAKLQSVSAAISRQFLARGQLVTGNVSNARSESAAQMQAARHVINAHGKFYGLRSKYDGRGNKREPLKG